MIYPGFLKLLAVLVALAMVSGCARKPADALLSEEEVAELKSEAASLVSIFDFDRANPIYAHIRRGTEQGSEDWALATFGLATTFWHSLPPNRNNIAEATRLFTEITTTKTAESVYWGRAHLNLGRIAEMENFPGDRVDTVTALNHYRQVLTTLPGTPEADEAAGRIAANSLFDRDHPERLRAAFQELRAHLERGANPQIEPALWNFLGENYWNFLEDAGSSVYAMIRTANTGAVQPSRLGVLYWRIAWLAERELHDIPLAMHYYRLLYETLPRSTRSYEARLAYQRLVAEHPELAQLKSNP
ncbi:MAG: hypothetical protein LR015_05530 [Verrucomicrobia bacterium]|nr:hypothetical protein [Verrucomicrobiota bacterium]